MRKANFLLLACFLLICFTLAGCATVMEQIQQTTGSQIKKVEELAATDVEVEEAKEETVSTEKEEIPKSPAPHIELEQILEDEGRGKYAGEDYDKTKVIRALKRMPKGLSEDKAYAYLLGLVGENYKQDVEVFDGMKGPNYEQKIVTWQALQPPKPAISQEKEPENGEKPIPPPKKANFIVLLDASSSMKGKMNEKSKMYWAEKSVRDFAASLPKETTTFTLRVYGHQGSNDKKDKEISCMSTEKLYSASEFDETKMNEALQKAKATGWTPLAHAIKSSYEDLQKGTPATVENIVLIISDGKDTCGGDPVQAAKLLQKSKVPVSLHVIGLDVEGETESELRGIADAVGGDYETVADPGELKKTLQSYREFIQQMNEPWQLRAADALLKAYQFDYQRLNKHYDAMMKKTDEEHRRLDEANDFIKQSGQIDGEAWVEIGNWIDQRWKQVGHYSDRRWKEISMELDNEWDEQLSELEESWKEEGGNPEVLEKRSQQRLKENFFFQYRESKERVSRVRVSVESE